MLREGGGLDEPTHPQVQEAERCVTRERTARPGHQGPQAQVGGQVVPREGRSPGQNTSAAEARQGLCKKLADEGGKGPRGQRCSPAIDSTQA